MIVEPVPTNPRGPLRLALRVAGIGLPVVLLAGVVALGSLGPRTGEDPVPANRSPAMSEPAAPASPAGRLPGTAVPTPLAEAFPAVIADLAVIGVPEARAAVQAGPERPLAVAGYLVAIRPTGTCAMIGGPRGEPGPLCERTAVLASDRPAPGEAWATSPGSKLRVRLAAGVRLPTSAVPDEDGTAPGVVIVGRARAARAACDSIPACDATFTADRVGWVAGRDVDLAVVTDSGIDATPPSRLLRNRGKAELLATGRSGTILVSALVRPATVGAIDPVAARAMRDTPVPGGLVWYVRGLETAYDPMRYPLGYAPPRLSWVVMDDTTGAVVASGRGAAMIPAALPPPPAVVDPGTSRVIAPGQAGAWTRPGTQSAV